MNDAGLEINALDASVKDPHVLEQFSDGADDMRNVQIARRHFVQHWGKEKEILAVDEGDLDILIASQGLFEIEGRVQPAKTASKNQNV